MAKVMWASAKPAINLRDCITMVRTWALCLLLSLCTPHLCVNGEGVGEWVV